VGLGGEVAVHVHAILGREGHRADLRAAGEVGEEEVAVGLEAEGARGAFDDGVVEGPFGARVQSGDIGSISYESVTAKSRMPRRPSFTPMLLAFHFQKDAKSDVIAPAWIKGRRLLPFHL
jgi:hypothetical protein